MDWYYVRYAVFGLIVAAGIAVTVWALWTDPDRQGVAVATPTPVVAATPMPTPSPTDPTEPQAEPPTPDPQPSESASEPEGTVLFGGGPAMGPWQQIGTVAEITHPGAPATASYAYREFWSDPEEENQPDWLWDEITREVAAQAVQLGEPLDRPFADNSPGSEVFNAFGGMEQVFPEHEAFSAIWQARYARPDGVGVRAWFPYLISFEQEVLARAEMGAVSELDVDTNADASELMRREVEAWAESWLASR